MAAGWPAEWADETACDFFARVTSPELDLLPCCAPRALRLGESLELLGEPSTGKSALLMECCARCVLPAEGGGHAACAIVLDGEGSFDLLRLAAMLTLRLGAAGMPSDEVPCAVEACLGRVRVLRCTNGHEILLGLMALRCELEAPQRTTARACGDADGRPRLLLLDCSRAFLWPRGGGDGRSFEARLGGLLGLLRRQRLSIVWSRCPPKSHNSGLEFPIVDRGNVAANGHTELSQPTMRLRLRRLESAAAHATRAASDAGVQLAFQGLLDVFGAGPGSPEPPLRREMRLTMQGVVQA